MLYRGYPLLQLPFQILHQLLEIDEQLSTWRYRHMSMVHRTIGTRIGTGGSSGRDYLSAALERHHLFREIAALTSFLIQRKRLPELAPEIERRLGFGGPSLDDLFIPFADTMLPRFVVIGFANYLWK